MVRGNWRCWRCIEIHLATGGTRAVTTVVMAAMAMRTVAVHLQLDIVGPYRGGAALAAFCCCCCSPLEPSIMVSCPVVVPVAMVVVVISAEAVGQKHHVVGCVKPRRPRRALELVAPPHAAAAATTAATPGPLALVRIGALAGLVFLVEQRAHGGQAGGDEGGRHLDLGCEEQHILEALDVLSLLGGRQAAGWLLQRGHDDNQPQDGRQHGHGRDGQEEDDAPALAPDEVRPTQDGQEQADQEQVG